MKLEPMFAVASKLNVAPCAGAWIETLMTP